VNLVVLAYDDRLETSADGAPLVHLLDARVHPGDRRAPGQVSLALVSKKHGLAGSGHPHAARYSAEQFAAITRVAADNVADVTDDAGRVIGRAYGVKADLLIDSGEVVLNTKTLAPSELTVAADDDGRDILSRMAQCTAASRNARAIARAAATASV
jgi:hypothetical protein